MTDDIKNAPNQPQNTQPTDQPSETTPVQTEASAQPTVASETAPMEPEMHTAKKPKKENNTLLAVVLAVLVALLIIGLGFAALNSSVDEIQPESNSNETSLPADDQSDLAPVEDAELQQELDQLDQEVEAFEGDEFSEDGLSDEALGL